LAKRSGRPCSRPSPQRMNLAATASSLGKSPLRSSVTRALHALFAPRSPHTPSLPDARPRSDRFRCGGRESNFLAVSRASALYFLSNMDVTRRTSYNTLRPVS
jgi:hypothetical protein